MARAMTEQAKKEKSEFIIDSAFKLFEEKSFKDFKMDDLAKLCGISKGLLFKYFRTKEMLFLSMLDREYSTMLEQYEKEFNKFEVINPENLKTVLINLTKSVLLPITPLIRLNMIKGTILEQNIDYKFAENQKLGFTNLFNNTFSRIVTKLEGITTEEFMNIFNIHGALLFGYLHSVTTSSVIKQVIEDHNLKQFEIDPTQETIKAIIMFIDNYYNL
jgi:AcrR family transcriptional regulator